MVSDKGERALDDLILLGYAIDIRDDGTITATNGAQRLHGTAIHGAIEWSDRTMVYHVTELAYIARLRARIVAGHP
ncbi:MAG TPA: hypothetical protein VGR57_13330 [Ktedonobacterales bacterium]|nr:hypothetical protein [Ktedonobacterales bacterium]